jgi:molecular chaperone GrpE
MDDVNDTPTTNEAPEAASEPEPQLETQPEPETGPDLEIAVEDDQSAEIAQLEKKLADEHDRLLRTAADLDNFRKRARRDVEDAGVRGRIEVLGEILPTIDALDLALKNSADDISARALIDGVEMVRRQFLGSMARFGLKPIVCVGASFDPNFHEAVAQIPHPDVPTGTVIDEMRRGYMLGDRLLRASLVIVSSGAPAVPDEAAKPDEPVAEGAPEAPAAPGEEDANG